MVAELSISELFPTLLFFFSRCPAGNYYSLDVTNDLARAGTQLCMTILFLIHIASMIPISSKMIAAVLPGRMLYSYLGISCQCIFSQTWYSLGLPVLKSSFSLSYTRISLTFIRELANYVYSRAKKSDASRRHGRNSTNMQRDISGKINLDDFSR